MEASTEEYPVIIDRARERVRRGGEFLDERKPGWFLEYIDLDEVDVGSIYQCILGQLYGDYWVATDEFGWSSDDEAINRGFRFAEEEYCLPWFDVLNQAWREYITERREADVPEAAVV